MNKCKQIKIDYRFRLKIIASAKDKTWNEAQTWAKEQGGRVPTINELQMLSILQCMGKIDTKFAGYFWSSEDTSSVPQGTAWLVCFRNGNMDFRYVDTPSQVICVKDI